MHRRLGPLHVEESSFMASDQAFGLAYAPVLRTAPWWTKFRSVRGFYYPTKTRLIWVYLDYR